MKYKMTSSLLFKGRKRGNAGQSNRQRTANQRRIRFLLRIPAEGQKLLLIGVETNKAVDKQVEAFIRI